jgi:hypothetical protein
MNDAAITKYIVDTYPDADVISAGSGTFFSCDPEKHWPNFATLVTSDEYDSASDLNRPGVYRLNIGLSKHTFDSLVGSLTETDYTVLDRIIPHPVYAQQHWVSILNPTETTFDSIVKPLLEEAHARVARGRSRKIKRRDQSSDQRVDAERGEQRDTRYT